MTKHKQDDLSRQVHRKRTASQGGDDRRMVQEQVWWSRKQSVQEVKTPVNTFSTPEQSESVTMCYNCNDATHVGLCDNVQKCADNEICYVESYTVSGHTKYRSGCRDASTCEADQAVAMQSGKFCMECCNKDFCNNQGCGEVIPDRNSRGPICFHCDHVSSPDECFQVEPCQSYEVCKIEKYSWFNVDFHYKMSCGHKQCDSATRSTHNSHVEKRAALLCNNCCSDDYCNRNCTQESDVNTGPSIIG